MIPKTFWTDFFATQISVLEKEQQNNTKVIKQKFYFSNKVITPECPTTNN